MTDPLVKAEDLGFAHLPDSDSFSEPKWLFRGLSFSLCSGRGLIVSGPSGSGKTTLLSLAARNPALLPAAGRTEGTLSPSSGQRPAETGLLFQENRLLDHLPVIENATLAADLAGVPHSSGNRAAREMLTALGLGSMLNRKPRQISGGEARRAALVRAVIGAMTSPAPLLIADEPDSGLDAGSARLVWELLERLIREKDMALLASSHGLMEAEQVENPQWEGDLRLKNLVPSEGAADLSEVAPLKDLPFPEPRGFTSLRRLGVCLRLSLRHIVHRPLLFAVQCLCFCALLAIPATSLRFSSLLASEPIKRAAAFPLLVGAPGSPFQLVLADVYRRGSVDRTLNFRDFSKLSRKWKGRCYPLHCLHRAGEFPVTGTTPSYFQALGETLESGQLFQILGQAVAGASLAREMRLSPGSTFLAGNPDPWDVSGTPPVKLRVTGILAPTGSVDDRTLFVDLNTAWAMDSAIHGHVEASGQVSDPSMRMMTDLSGLLGNEFVNVWASVITALHEVNTGKSVFAFPS